MPWKCVLPLKWVRTLQVCTGQPLYRSNPLWVLIRRLSHQITGDTAEHVLPADPRQRQVLAVVAAFGSSVQPSRTLARKEELMSRWRANEVSPLLFRKTCRHRGGQFSTASERRACNAVAASPAWKCGYSVGFQPNTDHHNKGVLCEIGAEI